MKDFLRGVVIIVLCIWIYNKCTSDSTSEKAKVEQTTKSSKKATKAKKSKKKKQAQSADVQDANESAASEAQPATKKQATPEDVVEEAKGGQASDDVIF